MVVDHLAKQLECKFTNLKAFIGRLQQLSNVSPRGGKVKRRNYSEIRENGRVVSDPAATKLNFDA